MKNFMCEDFLLQNEVAKKLYHEYAEDMPIFDYHCHLSAKEIWENQKFENITKLMLGGDHYKWRLMRAMGISEEFITGQADDYDKFEKFASSMPYFLGNPIYHWTHLELKRYFGIDEPLSGKNARKVYDKVNELLKGDDFTPQALIEKSKVFALCTTDDPADSLCYHIKIKNESKLKALVLPAFRPDKALNIESDSFVDYLSVLGRSANNEITSFSKMKEALKNRMDFFEENGCKASDQAFEYVPFSLATDAELEEIFTKAINGSKLSKEEIDKYKTELMIFLASEYKKHDWAMELHIGAQRNNNSRMFNNIGPDTGFDAIADHNNSNSLANLLDAMDKNDNLPKTILFTLNPKEHYVLTTIMGCFQGDKAKMQEGSAWWFLDNKLGMEQQMETLMLSGVLSKFCGMVTDSRSFLSYKRHEYFRRILCNMIGKLVEEGEYPADYETLEKIIKDICFNNAKSFIEV